MRLLSRLRHRLRYLLHRRRLDRDLEDELQFHLEMMAARSDSLQPATHRSGDLCHKFGNKTRFKEISREMFSFRALETLAQDARYALRMMRKTPVFTAIAVLSLALGIGANTAIFSLLDALLLRSLPVENPEQLTQIVRVHAQGKSATFWYSQFTDLYDNNTVFSGLTAFSPVGRSTALIDGQAEVVAPLLVSGNYYSVLGVAPALGRMISVDDDHHGSPNPVGVLSYGYWQRRFAGKISVLGKTIAVNGAQVTIIGVTPPAFFGTRVGQTHDITVPLNMQPLVMQRNWVDRPGQWLVLLGRLKPGVTRERAHAALSVMFEHILDQSAPVAAMTPQQRERFRREQHIELIPAATGVESGFRDQFSVPLRILMAVVGIVLLIACANVANLLLARAAARRHEISIRLAIGASRLRVVRQLLTESIMLAIFGGALGLLFARFAGQLLIGMVSTGDTVVPLDTHPDARVLGFTVVVSLLTGVLFGLAPAAKFGSQYGLAQRAFSKNTLARPLVVIQVGLSMLLLVGAGLFIRTFENLWHMDAGLQRENILLFRVSPADGGYKGPRLGTFWDQLTTRIRMLPGVRSVAFSSQAPLDGGWGNAVTIPGWTPRTPEERFMNQDAVTPGYFDTMGIPILLGRDFRAQDDPAAPKVAIINQTAARTWFGNDNPIGKRFAIGAEAKTPDIEVIGVVKDARYSGLKGGEPNGQNVLYTPTTQGPLGGGTVEVRTTANRSLAGDVRHAVQVTDARVPVSNIRTMAVQVESTIVKERLMATISTFFGSLALLLAAIGLYGIMAYAVARRTTEIGIRMALGAKRSTVQWMVLRAASLTRFAKSLLFGVEANDPLTIVCAGLLMLLIAVAAGFLPARRASRVDPMIALRYE
jgi:predicted permease